MKRCASLIIFGLGILFTMQSFAEEAKPAPAPTPPTERELVLTSWERDRWWLAPGAKLDHVNADGKPIGTTPTGEPLSRITLGGYGEFQGAQTEVNLPNTAVDLMLFLHKTEAGAGCHVLAVQDGPHGWVGALHGQTLWRLSGDYNLVAPAINHGWTWMTGFFSSKAEPPYRFVGLNLHGGQPQDVQNKPVTVEVGPVKVKYTPDEVNWLYADTQPKLILNKDGEHVPLVVRLANLGITEKTFELLVRPAERNLIEAKSAEVPLQSVTLKPGELKEIKLPLKLGLLGRYVIEYTAKTKDKVTTAKDFINVVNQYDIAEGFRHWTERRNWFSEPKRQRTTLNGQPGPITNVNVNNGISSVPLFPVQPRTPRGLIDPAKILSQSSSGGGTIEVMNTQLSPAWLLHTTEKELTLFGDMQKSGLSAPTFLAYATINGTKVIAAGTSLDSSELKEMSEPWLLAWWQGANGWGHWDIPYFVSLQHRPTTLKINASGVHLTFAGPVEHFTQMPLYGYAKLPQEKGPPVMLPSSWPADQLKPWLWKQALPKEVAEQCSWWSRTLLAFPYEVKETFGVDTAVQIKDVFKYYEWSDDWNTHALHCAPLSPTLALAMAGDFPMTLKGKPRDCHCATGLGPFMVVENATELEFSLNVGPFLFQTVDPNLTPPPRRQWGRS